MIKNVVLLAIIIFASKSVVSSDSETINYTPAQGLSINILCKRLKQGMTIQMAIRSEGVQSEPVITSISEVHPCKEAVSIDEDFDGDGIKDIAINDLSMAPNSSRQIFLVSANKRRIYSAGWLPIDAGKEKSGNYVSIRSSGGSIIQNEYSIRGHEITQTNSLEKVIAGDVCTNPVKTVVSDDACKGKLIDASFETPICIKHTNNANATIVPKDQCNFSL